MAAIAQTLPVTLDRDAAGRAAYETHVARNARVCPWKELRPETRENWRNVAAAVLAHVEAVPTK